MNPNVHNLSISSWNIQGLGDKCRDDFFLSCLKYDINIILESWKGIDQTYNLSEYKFFQKCRKKKKGSRRFSGGIVVFYKSMIHKGITEMRDITLSDNRLWFKLDKTFFNWNKDLYICACYVPPISSAHYDDDFSKLENEISGLAGMGNIMIIGDLNARIAEKYDFIENENDGNDPFMQILPDNYTTDFNIKRNSFDKIFNTQGQGLIDLCIASQLRILNGRFVGDLFGNMTCFKTNGASTIDYCLTDVDLINNVNFFQVLDPNYLSDHVQIVVHIECQKTYLYKNHSTVLNKLEKTYRWESLSKTRLLDILGEPETQEQILSFENTHFDKNDDGINQATEQLTKLFENFAKRACKTVKFRKKKHKKKKLWVDSEVRDLKKTVLGLGHKLQQQPFNRQLKSSFFKYSKDLKKMIKRKKYLYQKSIYDKLINWRETDPKSYWQTLNSLRNNEYNKDNDIPIDFENLEKHFQTQGEPQKFDSDFESKINDKIEEYKRLSDVNDNTDSPFKVSEINKCIHKLKLGKSTGPDCISNEIIKYSSILTCKSLTKLFNLILDSGKYPNSWRKSFTILIFKSGDKSDLNNYRGISIQNCIAKLFSSALNQRLIAHYENLFANQQFGFRGNHRTSDSIFILKTLILKYVYTNKTKIFSCFVDLRRAFDSLWHNGLLYKLRQNKIGCKFYNILSDMYSYSQSAVKIDNEYTDFFKLKRGVKQGDSLSPTLFNCFINDLHDIFDKSCDPLDLDTSSLSSLSFADDLVLLSKSQQGLQKALNKLEEYCHKWQLTVNIKKTKVLVFQKTENLASNTQLYYKKIPLVQTKEYNFLGNIIDSKGTFKKAVAELGKKAMKVLFALKTRFKNFNSLPVNLSCKLFDTLIRPVLLYNSEIWFMDSYLTVYRSFNRASKNGTHCDTLSLEDKFNFEKLHNNFCKSVLGVKKTASNIASKSELGRLPLSSFIKTQTLMYYFRIALNDINPFVKEALIINKNLHSRGKYSWYTFIKNIADELDIDISHIQEDKSFKKIKHSLKTKLKHDITKKYESKTLEKLSNLTDSSKLFLYSKLKTEIKLEEYLQKDNSFINRQMMSKFRLSDHILKIEMGRYQNIPREQRLCTQCSVIDDEYHFFFNCKINGSIRDNFLSKIKQNNPNFSEYILPFDKLKLVLNPQFELLPNVCDFIKQSLELRK